MSYFYSRPEAFSLLAVCCNSSISWLYFDSTSNFDNFDSFGSYLYYGVAVCGIRRAVFTPIPSSLSTLRMTERCIFTSIAPVAATTAVIAHGLGQDPAWRFRKRALRARR